MRLSTEQDNEFRDAKTERLVLADYPTSRHPETLTEREAARLAEETRQQEEQRRAQMTAEDRKIEELQRLFDTAQAQNQKNPGGSLGQRFNKIVDEAQAWPQDRKDRLIELLQRINRFLDGNPRNRRARIDSLRPGEE